MRCDPPRDNLPPTFRCGDPSAMGNYLRMQDQSGDMVPGVRPSIPQDHLEPGLGQKVTQALDRQSALCDRINLLRKIVGHYMAKEGLTQAKWTWAELLKANAVTVEGDGKGGYVGRIES